MRFKTRARTSIRMGGAVVAGASLVAVAAGSISTAAASVPTVKISVASLIPGSTAAATAAFNSQVKQFEKANPGIKVTSVQYQWLGSTFAAKLAAGTLPTVFTVPFTDGRALGDNGQLADLTTYAQALPYFNKFNPAVIAEGIDAKNQVIAIPTASYAQALSYNRHLFTEAGLNPNDPPTTWAQLEADAKQISAEDRHGRLRGDGSERQHRRLDPDHARLRPWWPYGDWHRLHGEGDVYQPAGGPGAEHAEDDALDRQLDGLRLQLGLE